MNGNASERHDDSPAVNSPVFATTHWSVVLAAEDRESPEAAAALEKLCRAYWRPTKSGSWI